MIQNIQSVFKHKPIIKIDDANEINMNELLNDKFSAFQLISEKSPSKDNQSVNFF
jgi:hypothetical protein